MRQLFPNNTFVAPKMGSGDRLVIAEAPGEDESVAGEPLVGGAGRWFNGMCKAAGVKREELTIINTINCRPPDNIYPTDPDAKKYISKEEGAKAVAHCLREHVEPLVHNHPWKRIDLLGDKALKLLTGKTEGIYQWRGSPLAVPMTGHDKPIGLPTLHPAAIARDQKMLPIVVNDLSRDLKVPPEFYNLFPELEEVKAFNATEFAFDIETNGWTREISMVGLCAKPYHGIVVPFKGAYQKELVRIFRDAKAVVGHNSIQFDLPVLRQSGVDVSEQCVLWDTMLMQHLLFPGLPHDLEFVGSQFSNKPAWKSDKKLFQLYNARDVDVTMQAFQQLKPMLEQWKLTDLYHNVQVPLAKICHDMSEYGIRVETSKIKEAREKLIEASKKEEAYLPAELRSYQRPCRVRRPAPPGTLSAKTKKPVKFILEDSTELVTPWRSPDFKQKYLYGKDEPWQLGFEPIVDPKRETVTTGKMALERLVAKSYREGKPEVSRALKALQNLNKWDELITTFYKDTPNQAQRLHSSFNVHGTSTGRLSSSDPNLQNIPEPARVIYVASHPGWRILSVDFSGIENRLQSHFAGDVVRSKRLEDESFSEHKYLASKLTGIPMEQITKSTDPDSAYSKAKHVVHGVDRGLGALKASRMYGMDLQETKKLFALWKAEIAATISWQSSIAEKAKRDGYLRNPFGRMLWFYTDSLYTESLSFLPQGTAADIIFRCMIALMYERIGWPQEKAELVAGVVSPLIPQANLLLQVHDELVIEYNPEFEEALINQIVAVMTQPWPQLDGMKFPIGISTGDSWGTCEKYKFPVAKH